MVIVTADEQTSNGIYIHYQSDRGDLIGVPSNVQRVNENSTIEYSISLTLDPELNVVVNLQADVLDLPSHPTMLCIVSPSQVQFTNISSQQKIIITVGVAKVENLY